MTSENKFQTTFANCIIQCGYKPNQSLYKCTNTSFRVSQLATKIYFVIRSGIRFLHLINIYTSGRKDFQELMKGIKIKSIVCYEKLNDENTLFFSIETAKAYAINAQKIDFSVLIYNYSNYFQVSLNLHKELVRHAKQARADKTVRDSAIQLMKIRRGE